MKENLKAYFNFTKKERTGVAILMMVIMIVAVAPAFFPGGPIVADSTQLAGLSKHLFLVETRNSDSAPQSFERYSGERTSQFTRDPEARPAYREHELKPFPFDPNTLDIAGWQKLGVREKTAQTIKKYLSKGGRFRRPDDLLRIYGLSDEAKRTLLPYVRIAGDAPLIDSRKLAGAEGGYLNKKEAPVMGDQLPAESSGLPNAYRSAGRGAYKRELPSDLDINLADTTAFRSLPGIGPVLSKRIVQFRDKLGGFYRKDQLREVYGIHDTTYQKIESYLLCSPTVVKLNLNQADQKTLEQHPYFRRQVARAILAYREQHGQFKDLSELRALAVVTGETYLKLIAYATL